MFEKELEGLRGKRLLRSIRDRGAAAPGGIITSAGINIEGRTCINFASNDYLGLGAHPALIEAAEDAAGRYGTGAGASRLLSGGCAAHGRLEAALAGFKGVEAALLFNSGYAANTGIIPALAASGDAILSDKLNHASIIDGCRLSRARVFIYRHRDTGHLEELLKKADAGRKVIVTDTVFSMHGDIAPLEDIYRLSKEYGAVLYIDDAHGTGVLGGGRGALAHFGIKPDPRPQVIQMGTCSKALGSFGAFCAGSKEVIDWLTNSARSLIYSTALPPPVVAASLKALELLERENTLVERLWKNRETLYNMLKSLGLDTGESETPIIPLILKGIDEALSLSAGLFEEGIHAPAVRPPTVPVPLIRLTVTAAHTGEDIGRLEEALRKVLPVSRK
jgi:8-amino-7-oxononanoate synthase